MSTSEVKNDYHKYNKKCVHTYASGALDDCHSECVECMFGLGTTQYIGRPCFENMQNITKIEKSIQNNETPNSKK